MNYQIVDINQKISEIVKSKKYKDFYSNLQRNLKQQLNSQNKQMNSGNQTNRKISKMFKLLKDDLFFCKLCHRNVELVESAQIEFWRHQTECAHLEQLIDFWLQETDIQKQKNKKPKQSETQNEDYKNTYHQKKYFDFQKVKKTQKESKIQEKVAYQNQSENDDDLVISIDDNNGYGEQVKQQKLEELVISDSSCESGLMNVKAADFKSLTDWNQKKQKIEDKRKSVVNHYSFLDLVQKYFEFFVQQLMSKECYVEAICFILAKTGKVVRDLCTLRFDDLQKEQIILSQSNLLSEQLLKILNDAGKLLWEQYGRPKIGYLIKQPTQPKDVRALLDKRRTNFTKNF